MKKSWKTLGTVSLLSVSTLFAGWSTSHSATAQAASRTITWLIRSDQTEVSWAKKVVSTFEQANPGITVNLLIVPLNEIDQKLQTMIAAGTPPDVFMPNWAYGGYATYKTDMLNLTPYIKQDPSVVKGFIPKLLGFYKDGNEQLALPISVMGTYLYYNKALLKAAHIPFPTTNWNDSSWTWGKMVSEAKQLTRRTSDPSKAVFGLIDSLWPENADSWLWGGDYFSNKAYVTGSLGTPLITTSAGVRIGIQKHYDLIFKDKVSPTATESTGLQALGDPFLTGRVAMELNGGWLGSFMSAKFPWGVAAVPQTVAGRKDVLFTDNIAIAKQCKDPTDAWKLVKWVLNPNGPLKWLTFGSSPTPPPESDLLNQWFPYEAKALGMPSSQLKQLVNGAFQYGEESANHLIFGYNSIGTALDQSLNAVYSGQKQIPDALSQMQSNLKALNLK